MKTNHIDWQQVAADRLARLQKLEGWANGIRIHMQDELTRELTTQFNIRCMSQGHIAKLHEIAKVVAERLRPLTYR